MIPPLRYAHFYTEPADILTHIMGLGKVFQLLKAGVSVPVFVGFFYGINRADIYTLFAFTAVFLKRSVGFKRHVGQDGCDPDC